MKRHPTLPVIAVLAAIFSIPINAQVLPLAPVGNPMQPVPVGYMLAPQPGGIATTAQQGSAAQNSGAQLNTMMGAMMLSMCMSQKPSNPLMCMMGAMMLAQGMMMNQNSKASSATATTAAAPQMVYLYPSPTQQQYPTLPRSIAGVPGVSSGIVSLNSAGYRVNSAGVTLPNGSFMPASEISTTEGMRRAGFSGAQIQSAQRQLASVEQTARQQISLSTTSNIVEPEEGASPKGVQTQSVTTASQAKRLAEEPDRCLTSLGHSFSSCNETFTENCKTSALSGCEQFKKRFCGIGPVNEGKLLADGTFAGKTGEGLGTAFCGNTLAGEFCRKPGRDHCLSCRAHGAPTTKELEAARKTCPLDPIFMDPAYALINSAAPSELPGS